jgi:uncharacterized damage-inducible protein DinB
MPNENDYFLEAWEREAQLTLKLLRALPKNSYDFRPDKEGRSVGELSWHLAELDGYITHGVEKGDLKQGGEKPPGMERPRTIEELAPGYERIHRDAVERVRKLRPEDYNRTIPFFDGSPMRVHDMLWGALLHHLIHHRGQLSLMCRLAGGTPPGIYGPTREETAALRRGN